MAQQTAANRVDQTNPWGSTSWDSRASTDPTTGKPVTQWTENTTVDPKLQQALNSQLEMTQGRSDLANSLFPRAQQEFGQTMDWGNAAGWAGTPQAGSSTPTTSAYSFGGPRQQRIDTSRQGTPQLQQGLDFGGAQAVGSAGDTRARAEDAIYGSATSRLDPQWDRRQQGMESDLANRGISMNSDAYSRAMGDFGRDRNDAYQQAQMGAITGGGAEAQRDYSMDLGLRQQQVGEIGQQGTFTNEAATSGFNFGNAARQGQLGAQQQAYNQSLQGGNYDLAQQNQAFQQQQQGGAQDYSQQMQSSQFQNQLRQQQLTEQMQQRGFSLNEINALISGQQVQMPQFGGYSQAGQAEGTDFMGAANSQYGAAMDAQNAKAGAAGQTMQGIGTVASIAAMAF